MLQEPDSPSIMSNKLDKGCVSLRSYEAMKSRSQPSTKKIRAARETVNNKAKDGVELILHLVEGTLAPKVKVRMSFVFYYFFIFVNFRCSDKTFCSCILLTHFLLLCLIRKATKLYCVFPGISGRT